MIFRGKILLDDERSLRSFGLEDGFAVHLVTRPPENERQNQATNNEPGSPYPTNGRTEARIISHNLIVGNVPFERTYLFSEPDNILVNILFIVILKYCF